MPEAPLKCVNCMKPALFVYEPERGKHFALCLDCHILFEQQKQAQLDQAMRLHNYYSSELDAISGVSTSKFQVPARAPMNSQPNHQVVFNNISISNANIGVLNTGSIGTLDVSIGQLGDSGSDDVAAAFRGLTEAIANSNDLSASQKNELIDTLSIVAFEATLPYVQRRKAPMRALLTDAATILGGVAGLAELWHQLGPAITELFR